MQEIVKDARARTYHSRGARPEMMPQRCDAHIVTLMRFSGDTWMREREQRAMKQGILIGLLIGLLLFCLVMWLWAVPAVDGALEAAKAVQR